MKIEDIHYGDNIIGEYALLSCGHWNYCPNSEVGQDIACARCKIIDRRSQACLELSAHLSGALAQGLAAAAARIAASCSEISFEWRNESDRRFCARAWCHSSELHGFGRTELQAAVNARRLCGCEFCEAMAKPFDCERFVPLVVARGVVGFAYGRTAFQKWCVFTCDPDRPDWRPTAGGIFATAIQAKLRAEAIYKEFRWSEVSRG